MNAKKQHRDPPGVHSKTTAGPRKRFSKYVIPELEPAGFQRKRTPGPPGSASKQSGTVLFPLESPVAHSLASLRAKKKTEMRIQNEEFQNIHGW